MLRSFRLTWLAVALVSVLIAGGCGRRAAKVDFAARVNDEAISREALAGRVGIYRAAGMELDAGIILEEMIDQLLMAQEARRRQVTADPAVASDILDQVRAVLDQSVGGSAQRKSALEKAGSSEEDVVAFADAMALDEALNRDLVKDLNPSDDELQLFFDENVNAFTTVVARHILVATKEEADAIRAQLVAGADFAQLAREKSIDTGSAAQGGLLPEAGLGDWVPPFEEAAFSLKPGELSEPVQSQFGWHIIRVEQRNEPKFADAREQVRAAYLQDQASLRMSDLMDTLRQNAMIEYAPEYAPSEGD